VLQIWQIADKENRGFLTPAGFGIVLRLIGHAQAGREPTVEIALQPGPLPRFDGISIAPAPVPVGSPPPAAPIQAQGTGGAIRIPPLTPEKATQYASLFERQPLSNNMLSGEQARTIFEKSGLPNEALGRIWQLSDTEQRGALVATEFIIAMHLLTSMKSGALRALPNVLPAPLYEAATRRGSMAAAPRQSPANTGMSAIPRQLSGTAQVRTGSPLGRPPIGPQGTGAAGVSDWAVTANDKAKFDQIYNDLDKANKGVITGEEAVPFFSQSNLPEDSLAQIWDLSDINSQGHLTRDEFAVAMYLIRQQRMNRGQPLPATLPPNLIPPSMRTQARPPTATSAFEPPPMTQPPPQPKSALDDLFGLDTSSPAPAAPLQTTMSTGGSNANDPFAGGSSNFAPTSPIRANTTSSTFKPFVPSSSFGRGLSTQPTGEGAGAKLQSASDDLLGDTDPEVSKNLTGETTELANLSNQVSSLSKQMQDTQAKRSTTQTELNQTNSQKQNFEQRLAQLRTLYEKEAEDTRALEEKLRLSRAETQKLQSECMVLEGNYRDIQSQHQQVLTQLQADQQENTSLREKIRVVNAEIAQLKPQIDKLKSDARQQKGLVAINKKQLSTTEGERDKLKTEAEDLAKGNDELSREASPAPNTSHIASPALSTGSGNNPFFRRTASTDIMGAFASPPARASTDKSFDEVFGPTTSTPPPMAAAPFKPQITGASTASASASAGSVHTPPTGSPVLSRQGTLTVGGDPPAPPESRQMSSSFLPFPEHSDSLSSSRQVSPPASRAEGAGSDAKNPFPGDFPTSGSSTNEGSDDKSSTPGPSETAVAPPPPTEGQPGAAASDPFSNDDQAKAKADFDNAFAAFTSAKEKPAAASDSPKPPAAFASEFPPISELERDDDSESDSEGGGFDDDFAPASPQNKGKAPAAAPGPEATIAQASPPPAVEGTPTVPPKEPLGQT
jgi:epidermal growth factor receptor substrate 15